MSKKSGWFLHDSIDLVLSPIKPIKNFKTWEDEKGVTHFSYETVIDTKGIIYSEGDGSTL